MNPTVILLQQDHMSPVGQSDIAFIIRPQLAEKLQSLFFLDRGIFFRSDDERWYPDSLRSQHRQLCSCVDSDTIWGFRICRQDLFDVLLHDIWLVLPRYKIL